MGRYAEKLSFVNSLENLQITCNLAVVQSLNFFDGTFESFKVLNF